MQKKSQSAQSGKAGDFPSLSCFLSAFISASFSVAPAQLCRDNASVLGGTNALLPEPPLGIVTGMSSALKQKPRTRKTASSRRVVQDQGALFQTAFHGSPALHSIVRLSDNVIVEANEAFGQMLGYRREDVLGKTPFELHFWVKPELLPIFREQLQTKGRVRNFELEVRAKDGSIRTVLLSSEVVSIDGVPHSMNAGVDITDRKLAEAKLRENENQLQKALETERELNQLKSDFVSLVSHEFRTPLEIIMSSADNLDRYHERLAPEKRSQLLRTIHKSVRRMSFMMEDVLLMGRFDSGRMEFKPVAFDLASFCRRLREEMETTRNRRCSIQLTVEGKVAKAQGDEGVLRHILTNLLSNAMKYSEAGQPVVLAVSRRGKQAIFRVADRGCGIPAADQARLFQAFHRASNVRQLPGTGLGLVIVKRSVALHGGEIEFESTEGKGTTFTVRLPMFP
jgi:PAS domain S-box-containing protein